MSHNREELLLRQLEIIDELLDEEDGDEEAHALSGGNLYMPSIDKEFYVPSGMRDLHDPRKLRRTFGR